MPTVPDIHRRGTRAAQTALVGPLTVGTLWFVTDEAVTERWTGSAWESYSAAASGAPVAHHASHETGGSDAIALDTLAAPTDVTTLNASASAHGLLRKLSGVGTDVLKGDGSWGALAGSGSVGQLTDVIFVRKTANESVASNTIQDDDQLSFAVGATQTWLVEVGILADGSQVADMTYDLLAPAGATGWVSGVRLASPSTGSTGDLAASVMEDVVGGALPRIIGLAGAGSPIWAWASGLVVTGATAGLVKFRWAQNVTTAGTPTIVKAGSYLLARRVA